jgi:hypothetical protein
VQAFFQSGLAIDVVLLVMALEGLWLWRRGRGTPLDILLALLPGALILVAARSALTGGHWAAVALPLALSWPVHLADIRRRGW